MENNLPIRDNQLQIDSMELLTRYLIQCKSELKKNKDYALLINYSAEIVTAVYYFRQYPDINEFINKYLKKRNDYFYIQWIRTTWASFGKMSEEEISNLVINQIPTVANSEDY